MTKCAKCGKELPEGSLFCPHCGEKAANPEDGNGKGGGAAPDTTVSMDQLKVRAADMLKKLGVAVDETTIKTLALGQRIPSDPADALKGFQGGAPGIIPPDVRKASRPYSFNRLFKAIISGDWSEAKNEYEMHLWMKKLGYGDGSVGYLAPINSRSLQDVTEEERAQIKSVMTEGCTHKGTHRLAKALGEGTDTAGGFLVQPEYAAEIIDLIRAKAVVQAAGAREIPLPKSGQLLIPKITGSATAIWLGENQEGTESEETFGMLHLIAKKLMTLLLVSNELVADSTPDAEAVVRDDIGKVTALAEDLAFIQGAGTSTEPKGIANNSGVTLLALGANGAVPGFDNLSSLIDLVEANDATDLKMITSPRLKHVFRTIKDSNSKYIYTEPGTPGMIQSMPLYWGIPVFYTSQIPINLVKGGASNCTRIIVGMFSEAVIGRKAVIEFSATKEGKTLFKADQTMIKAISRVDFGLRTENVFAHIADAKIA